MLNSARAGRSSPAEHGSDMQSLSVFIEDVEGHHARVGAAGANIVEELHETIYGEFQYGVTDVEEHHWLFSRPEHDVSPDWWGATITNPLDLESVRGRLPSLRLDAAGRTVRG